MAGLPPWCYSITSQVRVLISANVRVLSLGVMSCLHLRPSLEREHTVVDL